MKPLTLTLRNVGRFPETTLQLPDRLAAITGPNGAGKSTILNSIEVALFADGGLDLAALLSPWADSLLIQLEFEHGGERFRVRRGYKVGSGGRGTATLDLEREEQAILPGTEWIPLTRETAGATQAHLENLIGLTRAAFNASSFLAQGNAPAFLKATPAEKKQVLGAILDARGLWPRLAERAKTDVRAAEAELAAGVAKMAALEETAAALPGIREQLEEDLFAQATARLTLDAADEALIAATAAQAANAAVAERAKAAANLVDVAEVERDRVGRELFVAQEAVPQLGIARSHHEALGVKERLIPELELKAQAQREAANVAEVKRKRKVEAGLAVNRQAERWRELGREHAAAVDTYTAAKRKLEHLEGSPADTERCDRCQQHLDVEARSAAILSLTAETRDLYERADAKLSALEEAQALLATLEADAAAIVLDETADGTDYAALLNAARQAARERAGLAVTIRTLEETAAKVPALEQALSDAETALTDRRAVSLRAHSETQDNAELERAANGARAATMAARSALDAANAAVTRLEEQQRQAEQAGRGIVELANVGAEAHKRLDLLRLAERAFGRDGIPTLIAENALNTIEADMNWALEQSPTSDGPAFRATFVTQREQKTVEHLKETLELMISAPDYEQESASLSGGEESRVAFALHLALSARLGESRILIVDELPYLDEIGEDALVGVLRASVARGMFDVVLVVSHSANVRDQFDSVVEVVKLDGLSRLVGDIGGELAA